MDQRNEIKNEIEVLRRKLSAIELSISEKNDTTIIQDNIYNKLIKLEDELLFFEDPLYSNGTIDLYLRNKEDLKAKHARLDFIVTLHDIPKRIGSLAVIFDSSKKEIINIAYGIDEKHRGHNYTIAALDLLRPLMQEKGEKATIVVHPNNIPSNKIAERFGGKLVLCPTKHNTQSYNIYEVDLKQNRKKQ